ncbi:MAG TPA: flagellar basal body P-ring protein FlgI, partial [Chroococcales cyanobacterium]
MKSKNLLFSLFLALFLAPAQAEVITVGQPVRIKDVASIQGARDNQLTGLGVVVGLNGSGDTQSTGITERA